MLMISWRERVIGRKRERDEERSDEEESKKEEGEQVDRWLDVRDYRSRCIEETNERDYSTRWTEKGKRSSVCHIRTEREFGLVNKSRTYAIRSCETRNERIPVRKLL